MMHLLEIESELEKAIASFGPKSRLRDAIEYALLGKGKRFRPILVFHIAEGMGKGYPVLPSALAVEYFHTASLIADDLPCMDDEILRRGRPPVHLAFDEATAVLASYSLIASGYEQLSCNTHLLKERGHPEADGIGILALENVTKNAGILGATGGQYEDLFPPPLSPERVLEIHRKKTGALFEIAFVLGWLFGGGVSSSLPVVQEAAHHFGLAFQIADDFDDLEEDLLQERPINYPAAVGKERAQQRLATEIKDFEEKLSLLGLCSEELRQLPQVLSASC